ncbi:uncharacterized protein JN550_001511 [Neoarthrinium moseri]|uniref:uncharacterized protein n=1 Tax=Neoarthrinium moseri TaxID=1658444 RepID=UPI001FDD86A3|nr:uncharacterized protein JN550_001511 [Neoarthrinium moseri]KAI1876015.1 hypothetical protein JN550_001511 [Neoarthrinium moseri]
MDFSQAQPNTRADTDEVSQRFIPVKRLKIFPPRPSAKRPSAPPGSLFDQRPGSNGQSATFRKTRYSFPVRDVDAVFTVIAPPPPRWKDDWSETVERLSGPGKFTTVQHLARFTLFNQLPPELRRLIWRQSWEHRDVIVKREVADWSEQRSGRTSRTFDYHRELQRIRVQDAKLAYDRWVRDVDADADQFEAITIDGMHSESEGEGEDEDEDEDGFRGGSSCMKNTVVTRTWTDTQSPPSMYVCHESRSETLQYFEAGGLKLRQGISKVWVNLNLDNIRLSLHTPLHLAFTQETCARLVRISVPELAPTLSRFSRSIGHWDPEKRNSWAVPKVYGVETHDADFRYVWSLLRWKFPNLREINLERFTECNRYESTKTLRQNQPLDLENLSHTNLAAREANLHCHSCMNIQHTIKNRFTSIGQTAYWDHLTSAEDLERVYDAHCIMRPMYKKERIVIGAVKAAGTQKKDEEVVVNYWATRCKERGALGHPGFIEKEPLRREIVARSLEMYLGCAGDFEYLPYKI